MNKYTKRISIPERLERRTLLAATSLPLVSFRTLSELTVLPIDHGQVEAAVRIELNNDGIADYAAAIAGPSSVKFLLTDEASSIREVASHAMLEVPFEILVGDLNGDSWNDVIVGSNQRVEAFINRGNAPDEEQAWLGMEKSLIVDKSINRCHWAM